MKKIWTLLILMLIGLIPVMSQNFVDEEFASLKDDDNNTVVFVSGRLFTLAAKVIPDGEHIDELEELVDIKELASKITSFNLVKENDSQDPFARFSQAKSKAAGSYDELMSIRDNDSRVSIYVDEEDGTIYEIVGLVTSDDEFIVFSLTGEIDLDEVGKLLSKINEQNKNEAIGPRNAPNVDEMKIYPNPAGIGKVINIEVPSEMIGGNAQMFDMSGNLVENYSIQGSLYQLDTENIPPGKYILRIQKDDILMQKKVIMVK